MSLLDQLAGPHDLKQLRRDQLPELAQELRTRLIDCCSVTGGHIGASLGVVELSIALLYEFDSPTDKIVWDVGHQAYAWKLLTGRNDRFTTLRTEGTLGVPQARRIGARPVRRGTRRHGGLRGPGNGHRARPQGRAPQGGRRAW